MISKFIVPASSQSHIPADFVVSYSCLEGWTIGDCTREGGVQVSLSSVFFSFSVQVPSTGHVFKRRAILHGQDKRELVRILIRGPHF